MTEYRVTRTYGSRTIEGPGVTRIQAFRVAEICHRNGYTNIRISPAKSRIN